MASGYFVTGTDTGVGKTVVSCALLAAFNQHALRTAALKPIASGSEATPDGLRNEDALALQAAASVKLPYEAVNPYAFAPPIAPHIAADLVGAKIEISAIVDAYKCAARQADVVIVEGVGGWQVPLNARETTADLAVALGLPVILVVGIRLGCLNHALLSMDSIRSSGLPVAGWVANHPGPKCDYAAENVETLRQRWGAVPMLGELGYGAQPDLVRCALFPPR